jgi:SAM-dependent methyltransferase
MSLPVVVALVAQNENQALANSSFALNLQLQSLGLRTEIVDLNRADCFDRLQEIAEDYTILFAYGFAGIGSRLASGGQSFWDRYQIPYFGLCYDHPFYVLENHTAATPWVINGYGGEDFFDVQKDYIQSPQPLVRLALTSCGHEGPAPLPWQDRPIRALYLKTGKDPKPYEDSFIALPQPFRDIIFDVIAAAQKDGDLVLTDLVAARMQDVGMPWQDHQNNFMFVVRQVDEYLRHWRSTDLVRGLLHTPLTIVGGGWDHIDKTGARATFQPPVPSHEARQLLTSSRFILNTHPYGRTAWHERVLQGLEDGAAVISDRTRFTDRHFGDVENFVGFDWSDDTRFDKIVTAMDRLDATGFDPVTASLRIALRFPPVALAAQMLEIATQLKDTRPRSNGCMRKLVGPFPNRRGACYMVDVPFMPVGDEVDDMQRSRLYVYEDGKPIGTPHHQAADIASEGQGRFSHWQHYLLFSASDNTDPNSNGRTYTVQWSHDRHWQDRLQDALACLRALEADTGIQGADWSGKRVLEAGPGQDFGLGLLLAGLGAEYVALERLHRRWSDTVHTPFIRYVMTHAKAHLPNFDPARLTPLLQGNGYMGAPVRIVAEDAETVADLAGPFDLICSFRALEHVADPDAVLARFASWTKPGGWGVHLVDYCDYSDYSHPLDFLLIDDASYDMPEYHGPYPYDRGNRWRHAELCAAFVRAGFRPVGEVVLRTAQDRYLEAFLPRVRASASRFKNMDRSAFGPLTVRGVWRR